MPPSCNVNLYEKQILMTFIVVYQTTYQTYQIVTIIPDIVNFSETVTKILWF